MVEKRVITYSLLAHINNNLSTKGIKDLSEIFIPLIKRVIAKLYQNGIDKGQIKDLKDNVDSMYGFDIPYPILIKVVQKIVVEANKQSNNEFQFFGDHAFIIKKYVFTDYDDFINKQASELLFLSGAYINFIKSLGFNPNSQPSIFEFLDKNRINLSKFFAKGESLYIDPASRIQAQFVNYVKNNDKLYMILKRVYLGSIIAGYLEPNYDEIKEKDVEFILDTNFIISLLDLTSIEAHHTCFQIIKQCKESRFQARILDFTIEETRALLNRTADDLQSVRIFEQLDSDNIHSACYRRGLTKTDLQRISSGLEDILTKQFGVDIIHDTKELRNRAALSEVYKNLQMRKTNPAGALHDATVIFYVQQKRGKEIQSFAESNCWFVVDTKNENFRYVKKDRRFAEIIRAEDLVNILWLSNPSVNLGDIAELGLTQLIAVTINNSLPNPRALRELDDNIQKYAIEKVDPVELVRLANAVASMTVQNMGNLEELNRMAKLSSGSFVDKLKEYAALSKEKEQKKSDAANLMIEGIKKDLDRQLREQETSLRKHYEKRLKKVEEIAGVNNLSLKEAKNKILADKEIIYSKLSLIEESVNQSAQKIGSVFLRKIIGLNILVLLFMVLLSQYLGWATIEPVFYFLGITPYLAELAYFCFTKKSFNLSRAYKERVKNYALKEFSRIKFDFEYFQSLRQEIERMKRETT